MALIPRVLLYGWMAAAATAQDASVRPGFHLFFGNGGHVTLERPPLPSADDAFTFECWFKSDTRPKKPVQLVATWPESKKDEDGGLFALRLLASKQLTFTLRSATGMNASVAAMGKWLDGRWHRVTATWDGRTLAAYVDGKMRAEKEYEAFGPLATTAHPLIVGPKAPPKARRPVSFDGCIGGVQLWRRRQTAAEIAAAFPVDISDDGLLWHHSLRVPHPARALEDFNDETPVAQLSPILARTGWVRTRSWLEAANAKANAADVPAAPFDLYCYDLAQVVAAGGRRVLVDDRKRERVGVLWQNSETHEIFVTWIDDSLRHEETHALTAAKGMQLAGGTSDEQGNVYYLTVQRAPRNRPEGFEVAATLHRARADGGEAIEQALDVSRKGVNIYGFHSGPLRSASIRFSKGHLGVVLPRQMHKSGDGLRHQGAIALTFRAKDLSLVRHHGQTSGHSMANSLTVNEKGQFVAVDLGDNYPRGVHLHAFDKSSRTSRLVFTFKTAHATRARNDSPVYDEITGDGKTFYKWSNDNAVYTELGGVFESKRGYTVVFSTEQSPDGGVLDNSRAFHGCPDPRNLALVYVVKDFGRTPGGSQISDTLMASLPRKPRVETGGYFDFGGRWRKQRVVGVTWLTNYAPREAAHAPQLLPRPDGNLLLLWEKASVPGGLRGMVIEPNGEIVTPEFSLSFQTKLNRQDRVLTTKGRTYFLAGDLGGRELRLYHVENE